MNSSAIIANADYDYVRRKARYGHRDWLRWKGRDGIPYSAPVTAENVKAAMLAVGTQGAFTLIDNRTGHSHRTTWWIANNIRLHLLRGSYTN